jgi:subtilisin-like proprotein convertase family protein|tara:strand:+ start:1556 stop:8944 length:7389 start_codon:yes stop_codon:yes gene_type:complete
MRKVYPFFFVILALLMSTPKILAAEELGHVNDAKTYWHSLGKATKQLVGQSIDADLSSAIVLELTESDLRQALNIGQTMRGSGGEIILPNADGKLLRFQIKEKSNFSPVLAAKFPNIKAFRGSSLDYPGLITYFSNSPFGLEAVIIDSWSNARTTIRKISQSDSRYIAYTKLDKSRPMEELSCSTPEPLSAKTKSKINPQANLSLSGQMSRLTKFSDESALSKYRLAVAVNGQYTNFHGGTKQSALAAINNTLTGLNFIFETDLGIKLELVDNNDEIIYLDSNTDPFEDTIDANTNAPLQATIDSVIGSSNYDIGHLFSGTGGGGNAGAIGSVCGNTTKGSAWSASGSPRGRSFVNLVAHEMGHQIGANHTFSYTTEGTLVNVEPASGSTIMSYAGTGADDLAFFADNYYHNVSIIQGLNYLKSQTCHVSTPIENNVPTVDPLINYTIPVGTPFVLTGSASDVDASDNLTYTWEQKDNGLVPSDVFGPTNTQGANFRSLLPSQEPTRYLPLLSSVISGNLTLEDPFIGSPWETLSTVPREFNFALTVRDNAIGGGGVAYRDMTVTVVDNDGDDSEVGAFSVTSQALGNVYIAGSPRIVTWDVAGTDLAPISVTNVSITMSTDGGLTYPYSLAERATNDGSHEIILPDVVTNTARIRVAAVGNIFYAINAQDFSTTLDDIVLTVDQLNYGVCQNDSVTSPIIYETSTKFTDTAIFSSANAPSGLSVEFDPTSATSTNTSVEVTFSASEDLATGTYPIDIVATSPERTQRLTYSIQNFSPNFDVLNLSSPEDGITIERLIATLQWDAQSNADDYVLEIATDPSFSDIRLSINIESNSAVIKGLTGDTTYYWRVSPNNFCGSGTPGAAFSFTTPNHKGAVDLPVAISADGENTVSSVLTINENLRITDLNVHLAVSHTYPQDLRINLASPAGVSVGLLVNACGGENDIDVVFDDSGAELECSIIVPSISGVIQPQSGNLSSFNEQSTLGDWTLTVIDEYNFDGGSIDYLALEIETDGGWSNTAPIAFSQVAVTPDQTIELTLEGLDPERLPLTYSLVEPPVIGTLVGLGFSAEVVGSIDTSGTSRDVVLSTDGKTAYLADGDSGIRIFDLTDGTNPIEISNLDTTSGNARGIALSSDEKTLYLANNTAGLQIIDVTNASLPSLLGEYNTTGSSQDVVLSPDGNTAFIADQQGGVDVIDVSDGLNPSSVVTLGGSTNVFDVDISPDGRYLYVADQTAGWLVYDVQDITDSFVVATIETSGYATGIILSNDGSKAYVADYGEGVLVYDLTNPASPVNVGSYETGSTSLKLDISDDDETLFVASSVEVIALDVRTSASISELASINLTGTVYSVAADSAGTTLVAAAGNSGVQVISLAKTAYGAGDALPQQVIFENSSGVSDNDSFTFKVSDGDLDSNVATVEVSFASQVKSDGTFTYRLESDGAVTVIGCVSTCPSVIDIPSVFIGAPVTKIANASFADQQTISLTIPNSILEIGDYAFVRNNIESATIGAGVTAIGASAFAYNQLKVLSFLGDKPKLEDDSFLTNRQLDYISYCPDKAGWPSTISTGQNSIIPVAACDAVNKNNTALGEVRLAVISSDASHITVEDLNLVLGLSNIYPSNLDLYQGLIELLLSLTFDSVRVTDLQQLINDANNAKENCTYSVYIVDVSAGKYPDEISWQIRDQSDQLQASGGAPFQDTICLADDRHTLEMADNNEAGTNNGWDFADFMISNESGDRLFTHSLREDEFGFAAVNVGVYPNQAPIIDDGFSADIGYGQSVSAELVATDSDDDPIVYKLSSAPRYGELRAYISGSGIIGEVFLDGGAGVRGVAVSNDGQYAFLADYDYGFKVIDISDPTIPQLIGSDLFYGQLYNVTLSKNNQLAYVSSRRYGMLVYDISDPTSPIYLSQILSDGIPLSAVASSDDQNLYIADYSHFTIVNVSNAATATPDIRSSIEIDDYAWDISLSSDGSMVFLASQSLMLIFDVSDPESPTLLSSFETNGIARGITLSGDYKTAYLANGESGMQIIDVSDVALPVMMGSISSDNFMNDLMMSPDGKTVTAVDRVGLIQTIDIADPANPVEIRSVLSGRDSWRLTQSADGEMAYIADGYSGFKVVDVGYSARSEGSYIESKVTYVHTADSSINDSFAILANDGLDDSNVALFKMDFIDDADGDGIENDLDNCPSIANEVQLDTDGDGQGDDCDNDDDNDGVEDGADAFPLDSSETLDTDGDGVGDNADWAPNDISESADTDGDGVGDNADAFPTNAAETLDTDSDGLGDNEDPDIDGDGILNNDDKFPLQSKYSADTDNDGMPDAWEIRFGLDPNDPSDSVLDQDGDGISNLEEFLAGTPPAGSLDIDGNSKYDALTDGLLLLRGMFGLDGSTLVTGTIALDATYTAASDIELRIDNLGDLVDIDGNGQVDALTDGLLILRYLFGLNGDALINGVIASDASRTSAAEIEAYLDALVP